MSAENAHRRPGRGGDAVLRGAANASAPLEFTAWLRGLLQEVAQNPYLPEITGLGIGVIVTLRGATGRELLAPEIEDRTCDRCSAYVPRDETLVCFSVAVAPRLTVTGGFCATCARREGML